MSQLKDEMIPYLTKEEIKDLIKRLAKEIQADYKGKELTLICCLKGSILFVADLARQLDLNVRIDFVKVSGASSGDNEEPVTNIQKDIALNMANKHVLIVEEIIDTAKTLAFLRNRLMMAGPASLKIVTLLDKPARRSVNIKPDYVGRTIEDRFVVGYGLDEDGLGRNYSDIYYLRH